MKVRPGTAAARPSVTHTSPSAVDSTRGTRSLRAAGASRSQRSGGGFTCESAEISRGASMDGGLTRAALPYPEPHPGEQRVGRQREAEGQREVAPVAEPLDAAARDRARERAAQVE